MQRITSFPELSEAFPVPAAAEYLKALDVALEVGKILGDEAKALAKVAGRGGMAAQQVRCLNERFLN